MLRFVSGPLERLRTIRYHRLNGVTPAPAGRAPPALTIIQKSAVLSKNPYAIKYQLTFQQGKVMSNLLGKLRNFGANVIKDAIEFLG